MSGGQLARRMDTLEDYMKDLSFKALRTEREIFRPSEEMGLFKDEMRLFKDEMGTFKTQAEQDRKAMNRKWGELANKMGTMVEDLVAPSLPRVARELFKCKQPELFAVRMRKRKQTRTAELDVLLVCPDVVLVNETKSKLNSRDVDDLLSKEPAFRDCFPEYAGRRWVLVLASLYVDPAVVRYATRNKVLVMGMADETMEVLNPEAANPA